MKHLSSSAWDLSRADSVWPACLDELAKPPLKLRVAGALPYLDHAIAIVGTRRASPHGLTVAHQMAHELATAGYVVISGGAEGIDAAAHEGALACQGLSIAVLAGGLARPYPRAHTPLFERIAEHGAVLSEAEDDDEPRRHLFLARNRLIAALARAVVVVQAPLRSGALSTALHARKLGRPVLALPWAVGDVRGEGGLALLAEGQARLCRGATDIIEVVSGERPKETKRRSKPLPILDVDPTAIVDALTSEPMHVDELVARTGLPVARIRTILTTLVLMGEVGADEQGGFFRTRT